MATSNIKNMLGSVEQQRELFLLKFPDIDRLDISDMYDSFKKFDKDSSGDLDEREIQMMMADLGVNKTMHELRSLLSSINFAQGKRVQFMELCCASFGKDFSHIECHEDKEAMANAKKAADEKKALEDNLEAERQKEADEAKSLQLELQAESQLVCTSLNILMFYLLTYTYTIYDMMTADWCQRNESFLRPRCTKRP